MKNKKLKNKGLWVSFFAFIPLLLQVLGLDILPDQYTEIVAAGLSLLVTLGLISDPDKGEWYTDFDIDKIPDKYPKLINKLFKILVALGVIEYEDK